MIDSDFLFANVVIVMTEVAMSENDPEMLLHFLFF